MSSRLVQATVISGRPATGPTARTATTGCPVPGQRRLRSACYGRLAIGVGLRVYNSGMRVIGDRMSVSTAALIMVSAMLALAMRADTGEVGTSTTTAASTTSGS